MWISVVFISGCWPLVLVWPSAYWISLLTGLTCLEEIESVLATGISCPCYDLLFLAHKQRPPTSIPYMHTQTHTYLLVCSPNHFLRFIFFWRFFKEFYGYARGIKHRKAEHSVSYTVGLPLSLTFTLIHPASKNRNVFNSSVDNTSSIGGP